MAMMVMMVMMIKSCISDLQHRIYFHLINLSYQLRKANLIFLGCLLVFDEIKHIFI